MPRLELMACLIAARLMTMVISELNINVKSIQAWSDSKVAIYWINGRGKSYKQFVHNRVVEIRIDFLRTAGII